MAEIDVTMLDVAKKKPPPPGHRPNRSPGYVVYARIDPDLGAAWQAYLDGTEPTPTARSALELAFREFLTKRGLWPPGAPPAG